MCSSYSLLLSTPICAVPPRLGRAECRVHFLLSISRRHRCFAAVYWFLLRGCVLRPDDACQKRFSSYWIQKVQRLVKSFPTSIWLRKSASIQLRTSLLKFEEWTTVSKVPTFGHSLSRYKPLFVLAISLRFS